MRLALALSLCAGCASADSERGACFCPALALYPPAFSEKLAAEIEGLPEDSAALRALLDYAALRDQVRACQRILQRSKISSGHR